jgi:hypothetical protein
MIQGFEKIKAGAQVEVTVGAPDASRGGHTYRAPVGCCRSEQSLLPTQEEHGL